MGWRQRRPRWATIWAQWLCGGGVLVPREIKKSHSNNREKERRGLREHKNNNLLK